MAFDIVDSYEILSNGLFSGTAYEASITELERMTRIISHGLLEKAHTIVVGDGDSSGGLNDVGTATTL